MRLVLLPSQFNDVALTIALMGFPSRRASARGLIYMAVIASALAYPSAAASKVLHDASGAKTALADIVVVRTGVAIMLAPPIIALEASPLWIARQAS